MKINSILSDKLKALPTVPGVYQMLNADSMVLYVGKARNLKNRVSSYFQSKHKVGKTRALMQHVVDLEVIITQSETEALLLEHNLIKKLKPRFNVLLRDDKSYPYIYLSSDDKYPRLDLYRGRQQKKGEYFGPYPNVSSVKETLNLLQKLFRMRQCSDTFFKHRTRPCLQYQIGRCSAPCVGKVADEDYQQAVQHTRLFLQGKDQQIIDELTLEMDQAANELAYEQAAAYRDQIKSLRQVQEQQYVSSNRGDVDVVALAEQGACFCVQVLFIRGGRVLGSKAFFPKVPLAALPAEVLQGFVEQHYLSQKATTIPREIIVSSALTDQNCVQQALIELAERQIKIVHNVRGERARWLQMAAQNAEHSVSEQVYSKTNATKRFQALQMLLQLEQLPGRIECFDISHSSGEGTVASCVVFDEQGPVKSQYRRFNIDDITGGDDYAAMQQALTRRYQRLQAESAQLPDILLIDGGKGQLTQAKQVLATLAIDSMLVLGIAKGSSRKPGLEQLLIANGNQTISVASDDLALHLLQQIRDEAHRFAISGHRQRRDKKRRQSPLEGIPGVGAKKRRDLLRHFGGLQAVCRASIEEISKVSGINQVLAERIYNRLKQ